MSSNDIWQIFCVDLSPNYFVDLIVIYSECSKFLHNQLRDSMDMYCGNALNSWAGFILVKKLEEFCFSEMAVFVDPNSRRILLYLNGSGYIPKI